MQRSSMLAIVVLLLCSLVVSACQPLIRAEGAKTNPAPAQQLMLQAPSTGAEPSATEIFSTLSPAIAFVETPSGTGSGVLIEHGYLLSNAHVVWPFQKVRVVFADGSEYLDVPVFGWDLVADLALLGPIDTPIQPAPLVNSEDLEIGSDVYLIGYPAEVDEFPQPTITNGILSRVRTWDAIKYTFFQVDATITGGQSGGVMVTHRGDIVGISTFYYGGFGLAGSVGDALPRLNAMLGNDTGVELDARPFAQGAGAQDISDHLRNQWDTRRYVLLAPVDSEVELTVEGVGKPQITVWDANGRFIDATRPKDEQATEATLAVTIENDVPHLIEVSQPSSNENSFTLTSSHPLLTYADPDDGIMLATDKTIAAHIDTPDDSDYYEIELKAGDVIQITADSLRIDPSITLRYDSPTLEEVVVDDDSGGGIFGNNAQLTYKAPQDSTYLLTVNSGSYSGDTGGYFLSVSKAASDAELTEPESTHAFLPSGWGRLAWYEDSDNEYTVLYPYDWKQAPGAQCAPGATVCYAGPNSLLIITEESLAQLPKKDRNRAGYLQLLQEVMAANASVKIESVAEMATFQNLEADLITLSIQGGRVKGQRLVFVDEAEKTAFNIAFLATREVYPRLSDLTEVIFDSFRYWKDQERATSAVYHFDEGVRLAATQNYTDAIAAYDQSIALDDTIADTYSRRAGAYQATGDDARALKDLSTAIALEPDNQAFYFSRAYLHWDNGDFDDALDAINQAIKLNADDPSAYNQRALIQVFRAAYSDALADMEKVQELYDDELPPFALDTRAFVYLKMGDYKNAQADYAAALQKDFRSPYVLLGHGIASIKLGDMEEGKALLVEGMQRLEELKVKDPSTQMQDLLEQAKPLLSQ